MSERWRLDRYDSTQCARSAVVSWMGRSTDRKADSSSRWRHARFRGL